MKRDYDELTKEDLIFIIERLDREKEDLKRDLITKKDISSWQTEQLREYQTQEWLDNINRNGGGG